MRAEVRQECSTLITKRQSTVNHMGCIGCIDDLSLEGPWSRVTREGISGHASPSRCELLSTHSTAPHGLALKGRLYPVKVALVQGCAWRDLTPHGLFLECLAKPMKFVRST